MGIPIERPLHIVSSPENSITKTVSIDTNILDLYLSSGYDPDDFSVTHLDGVDVGVLDTAALTIDEAGKTISGLIKLNQRLDFENPIDRGENATDNDYEVAIFRVMSKTSSNDFKLIIRITNLEAETRKLEILVDSLHLDDINQQRGIREIYLYEDKEVMDPLMGNDPNNFLSDNLVERTSVMGNVDAMASTMNLYDNDDTTSGFLTATPVNNSGNTYHRLIINFTKEVNIEKVAIRGRQVGGYYGFVFILRDKNDHIVYVHQASPPLSKGSGSDVDATSTYAFVPDYNGFTTITDFNINLDNTFFDIAENTTNVLLIDNFSVAVGYEYERGEVSINPGADFAKFNTDNLVFIDNELRGLSFKVAPDAENRQDTDRNNVYEVGTVTISNFDGGKTNFSLPVRVVNVPSTVSLLSNEVRLVMDVYTSNIIPDLTTFVNPTDLSNMISLGDATYYYELRGADAKHFKIVGNALKTSGKFGFRNNFENNGWYDLQVFYMAENSLDVESLNISLRVESWITEVVHQAPWSARKYFQSVVLTNGDVLVMGGDGGNGSCINDIWRSSDGGTNWNQIPATGHWDPRRAFQALVLGNNDILVMGGNVLSNNSQLGDVWLSQDGGTNWSVINSSAWTPRSSFQAEIVGSTIFVYGGYTDGGTTGATSASDDGGRTWYNVMILGLRVARNSFQSFVINDQIVALNGLHNGHILGNRHDRLNKSHFGRNYWRSSGGPSGLPWGDTMIHDFQARNTEDGAFIMGGKGWLFRYSGRGGIAYTPNNNIYLTTDGAQSFSKVPAGGHWDARYAFQTVVLPNNNMLVMGGYDDDENKNDIWLMNYQDLHKSYNSNY